ncbi:PepSY-associated TM helix domain-containing protein [uncultured Marinobacter sp.]|uniref:PepSY-associated TM helix domain-containing protein n=1 Tax=uncultured Marinobacter sp. TaxID=187379 RepID=UPI0030D73090
MTDSASRQPSRGISGRSVLLRQLIRWHWVSSALALFGMLFFSISGITLNHAADISASPQLSVIETRLPAELTEALLETDRASGLPESFHHWLDRELEISVRGAAMEQSDHELYFSRPRPGGDAWLNILLPEGELIWESTDRGWISWLNDLHKGRHTGTAWRWFIDVFAVVSLVFCLTGLGILALHASERRGVWPVTGLGVLVPLLLLLLLVH